MVLANVVLSYSRREPEMIDNVAIFTLGSPSFELSTVSHDLVRQLRNVDTFEGAAPQVNSSTIALWLNELD